MLFRSAGPHHHHQAGIFSAENFARGFTRLSDSIQSRGRGANCVFYLPWAYQSFDAAYAHIFDARVRSRSGNGGLGCSSRSRHKTDRGSSYWNAASAMILLVVLENGRACSSRMERTGSGLVMVRLNESKRIRAERLELFRTARSTCGGLVSPRYHKTWVDRGQ